MTMKHDRHGDRLTDGGDADSPPFETTAVEYSKGRWLAVVRERKEMPPCMPMWERHEEWGLARVSELGPSVHDSSDPSRCSRSSFAPAPTRTPGPLLPWPVLAKTAMGRDCGAVMRSRLRMFCTWSFRRARVPQGMLARVRRGKWKAHLLRARE
jgi:hypothetical protein